MKNPSSLFQTTNYKTYLTESLDEKAKSIKGQRIRLAQYLNCSPSYISQVLNEHLDLTLEQALAANQFLGHTDTESRYFLHLVLWARAGTTDLKKYYQHELAKLKTESLAVKNRVKANRSLSELEQARYYKAWYFAAIHMIVSLPSYQQRSQISEALNLPLKTVNETVEFLISVGLLQENSGKLIQGERSLMIGSDSPFLIRHQSNWRLKALQDLDQNKPEHLHYSGVITCSQDDLGVIREIMMKALQEIRSVVKESKDETLAVYNLDLFGILDAK